MKAGDGDVDGCCGWALAGCLTGRGDIAACCCGGAVAGSVAGAGVLEAADFEERSKASEGCAFGSGLAFSGIPASSGETRSTVIGSAVTEPNGCTSAKTRTIVRADRWPSADAAMPERMNRHGSIRSMSSPAASIAAGAAASIPFRSKTEIGEPAPGASHLEDLAHFVGGQREVKNVDILRQPLEPGGPRNRRDILLHQPAQAHL